MNKEDQARFGLEYGHSPVAHKTICIDFDNTIVPWKPVSHYHQKAIKGAANAMRTLKKMGFTIVIFTSRMSPTWHKYSGEDAGEQMAYVKDTLNRLRIPYDVITSEKVPAEFYVDDKAIAFDGDWNKAMERILG